jgi:NAD(P)-dependent dehydrogenase (short-subunit alcohol dehydrogenase family)/acyl dehydratase
MSYSSSAADYGPEDLFTGMSAEFERDLTQANVDAFAAVSGDHNPLHVDPDYARQTNYERTLVHGAFQVGLASALIGMHLPGKQVLLGGVSAKFLSPLHVPSRVRVFGEISAWNRANLSGQLKVTVFRLPDESPVSEISMGFTLHREGKTENRPVVNLDAAPPNEAPTILVTGASGGLGASLIRHLRKQYRVIALHRSAPLPEDIEAFEEVDSIQADLSQQNEIRRLADQLSQRVLYGIVHCAWPGAPRGGLLASDSKTIERQILAGSSQVIDLARILANTSNAEIGGRLVIIGSIFGRQKPNFTLASYSLGKDLLESTVRLLAAELAPKYITANVIAPSMIQAGMNKHTDQRSMLREQAQIPAGRLCTLEDIQYTVDFLLSKNSEFISGQVLALTGARL